MAHKIQAIATYRPRVDLGVPASQERYMALATRRTTLSPGVVKNMQEAEAEALITLLAEGRPVHTGTAIYTPEVDLDGRIRIYVRPDRRLARELNKAGVFEGSFIHAEHIGKSGEELVALWNEEHPTDPVSPACSSTDALPRGQRAIPLQEWQQVQQGVEKLQEKLQEMG